ncbi:MAG: septum formation initiator family protein [Dysgonamonadaceae bacterium]|jgi:cell division protein FtsB|nr:septum formation initiator family protein [Dysgonamonadaceae bacterium]
MSATNINFIAGTEAEEAGAEANAETNAETNASHAKGISGKDTGKNKRRFNKYHITLIIFVVVILFVGDNTLFHRYQYDTRIRELQSEIQSYRQKIETTQAKLNSLQLDNESLERYAREQYLMTKPDEELYIITP